MNARAYKNQFKYENFIEIYSLFYELISIDILEKEKIITPSDSIVLHCQSILSNTMDGKYYDLAKFCINGNKMSLRDAFYMRTQFMRLSDISLYYYPFFNSMYTLLAVPNRSRKNNI